MPCFEPVVSLSRVAPRVAPSWLGSTIYTYPPAVSKRLCGAHTPCCKEGLPTFYPSDPPCTIVSARRPPMLFHSQTWDTHPPLQVHPVEVCGHLLYRFGMSIILDLPLSLRHSRLYGTTVGKCRSPVKWDPVSTTYIYIIEACVSWLDTTTSLTLIYASLVISFSFGFKKWSFNHHVSVRLCSSLIDLFGLSL